MAAETKDASNLLDVMESDPQKRNEKHMSDPHPGDYWHEMFCPYFVVIKRVGRFVVICDKTKSAGDNGQWTWNLDEIKLVKIDTLKKKYKYPTMDGYVCDVEPECHMFVVKWFEEQEKNG